jgi:hypothetical protein
LEATVDWTYITNELWMYVSDGVCTADQFATDACPGAGCPCKFSVSSEAASPKPRVLRIANASAGTRTLIVWSQGPKEEAVSYQVVLTTTGLAGAAATSPGNGSEGGGRKRARPGEGGVR